NLANIVEHSQPERQDLWSRKIREFLFERCTHSGEEMMCVVAKLLEEVPGVSTVIVFKGGGYSPPNPGISAMLLRESVLTHRREKLFLASASHLFGVVKPAG